MERSQASANGPSRVERQLSHLKIISRLLGHELHNQTSPRITLSRETVLEIQASLDLYIEEVMKNKAKGLGGSGELEVQAVSSRVN